MNCFVTLRDMPQFNWFTKRCFLMYKIAFFGSTLISEKIRIRAEPILEVAILLNFITIIVPVDPKINKKAFQ